ncbi:alpha/beta hydrolase [Ruminococcaceae bacterium OttesenSCG-928-A16]|nr:alpha/beta hydrolase [Ruminococcaceae bacterium OttesenSCG-928-A16]
MQTNNPNNPILLYLHGGPGDAALPLVAKYNSQLKNIFTVVTLEQRGAGKSYYPFSESEEITIGTFLKDIHTLALLLLKRFGQQKLYLVGHSWGSVLGLKFIQLYPGLVHTYVGCGQVVNMAKSSQVAYNYALQKNIAAKNNKVVAKLKTINCAYRQQTWLTDLLFVTKQVVKHKGSLYGKANYNRFVADFIRSPDYSLNDLLNRQKGSLQSIQYLWQELMDVDFENIVTFDVPVIFIEGRHDYHVSSTVVHEYFEHIKTEKQFHWFENSCHFPQWSEPQKFHDIMASLVNEA